MPSTPAMRALTRFARQLREEAEHLWAVAGDEVRFAPLAHGSCPSTGTCRATVTWMRGRFVAKGVDPDSLVLITAAGAGACKKHSWLRIKDPGGDVDIDITADQFTGDDGRPLPPVIVVPAGEGPCGRGRAKAWPRTPGKHVQVMVVAGGLGGARRAGILEDARRAVQAATPRARADYLQRLACKVRR